MEIRGGRVLWSHPSLSISELNRTWWFAWEVSCASGKKLPFECQLWCLVRVGNQTALAQCSSGKGQEMRGALAWRSFPSSQTSQHFTWSFWNTQLILMNLVKTDFLCHVIIVFLLTLFFLDWTKTFFIFQADCSLPFSLLPTPLIQMSSWNLSNRRGVISSPHWKSHVCESFCLCVIQCF